LSAVTINAEGRYVLNTRTSIILVLVTVTAFTSQMAVPLWVGAIIDDYGFSAETAGTVAAVEFGAVALTSFAIAARIHLFSVRRLLTIGLVLLIVANGVSTLVDSAATLTASRAVAGIGKGLVISAAFGLAGRSASPARSFALLNGGYTLFSALTYFVVPFAIKASGASGAFAFLCAATLLGACLLPWIPVARAEQQATQGPAVKTQTSNIGGLLALLALVVMVAGHSVIWTFIERLGIRSELSITDIGMILSAAALITLIGPAAAHILDTRIGYLLPVLIGVGVMMVLAAMLGTVTSAVVFMAAVPLFNIALLFAVPYLQALMSLADPKGRFAAAAGASMTLGAGFGAYVGGVSVTHLGLSHVATVSIAFMLIGVILVLISVRRFSATHATST
jgi:predicted MFS family arabinose efflux permease